jgi:hypothetical protein
MVHSRYYTLHILRIKYIIWYTYYVLHITYYITVWCLTCAAAVPLSVTKTEKIFSIQNHYTADFWELLTVWCLTCAAAVLLQRDQDRDDAARHATPTTSSPLSTSTPPWAPPSPPLPGLAGLGEDDGRGVGVVRDKSGWKGIKGRKDLQVAYVCMYVCMYVCTYVCTYVRTYVRTYVSICGM